MFAIYIYIYIHIRLQSNILSKRILEQLFLELTQAFDHLLRDMKKEEYSIRGYHTFKDEAWIGVVKTLAGAVHFRTLEHRVLSRYYISMFASVSFDSSDVQSWSEDEA